MQLKLGPGMLVAAAFVGPGTVTTCVLAGQGFGTSLLWVLVLATLATMVLQEMAARLGVGAGRGLGEALVTALPRPALRWLMGGLVLLAILVGNAAYQAGNLVGASLGAEALAGTLSVPRPLVVAGLAIAAAAVLLPGKYRLLERTLMGVVAVMSLAFIAALGVVRPGIGDVVAGLVPRVPAGSWLTVAALVGTTIVPYNLFLHAAAARDRWQSGAGLGAARADTFLAVGLGGAVSAVILLVSAAGAAALDGPPLSGPEALARALEPSFGAAGRWLVGLGLLGAGFSSAVTAPMAAGYVAAELFGAGASAARRRLLFRGGALAVLLTGTVVGMLGVRPTQLILVAQAANGLLLPVVGVFLLILMNRRSVLGGHVNGPISNVFGAGVVGLTLLLGVRALARAAGIWP